MTRDPIERWRDIEAVVDRALQQPTPWRGRFVARQSLDSTGKRLALDLVAADREAGSFLERPAMAALTPLGSTASPTSTVPDRVGPYRILRPIHGGGMGAVFLARRDDGEFRRDVAIKVLHVHIVCDETKARVQAERQILADLEHPNIARLYDGGTLADGRPYLVLEFVEGAQIDHYCAAKRSSVEERFALVEQLASALSHCHRRGLVHRDIKPSNVLVTHDGVVKLIDFGIAKHLPADLGLTRTGFQPRTPGYASPEQILGRPIDQTTDVHALALLLYELLTGCRVYTAAGSSAHEIERWICQRIPEPASLVVARRASDRVTADRLALRPPIPRSALVGLLRRRFDRPLARALAKDPGARPPSVDSLLADCRDTAGDRRPRVHSLLGVALAMLLLVVQGTPWRAPTLASAAPSVPEDLDLDRSIALEPRGPVGVGRGSPLPRWPSLDSHRPNVALLPLRSVATDRVDLRSIGLGHEIVEHLAQWPELRALGNRSTWRFATQEVDLRRALEELPDMPLFVGHISHDGSALDLDLEWVSVDGDTAEQAGSWSTTSAEACHLGRRVAETMARLSGVDPGVEEAPRNRPCVPRAFDLTLKARALLALYGGAQLTEVVELLERAVVLDPELASAWSALTQAHLLAGQFSELSLGESWRQACAAADRAAALRPAPWLDLVASLCDARLHGRCDNPARWLTDPGFAVPSVVSTVLSMESEVLTGGRSVAVMAHRGAAQDPFHGGALLSLAHLAWRAGDLDLADRASERALAVDPRFAQRSFLITHIALARGELARARAASAQDDTLFARFGRALVEHAAGRSDAARALIDEMIAEHSDEGAYQIAQAFAVLGDTDAAFDWLRRARRQHDRGLLRAVGNPYLAELQTDPRWSVVLPDPACPRLPFDGPFDR